jgi:hypothetical protein
MNLNTLAADLSKMDEKSGKNIDIVDAKIVLGNLRKRLHQSNADQCIEILSHILKGHPEIEFEISK